MRLKDLSKRFPHRIKKTRFCEFFYLVVLHQFFRYNDFLSYKNINLFNNSPTESCFLDFVGYWIATNFVGYVS